MDKYLKVMPFGIILVLSGKCIVVGSTFADVAFLSVLGAIGCYFHFATKETKFKDLEAKHLQLEQKLETKAKEVDDIKNHLSGLKLASAIRPGAGRL